MMLVLRSSSGSWLHIYTLTFCVRNLRLESITRVRTGPGNRGFPGLKSPGNLILVLESPGNVNWATFFDSINALKFLTR